MDKAKDAANSCRRMRAKVAARPTSWEREDWPATPVGGIVNRMRRWARWACVATLVLPACTRLNSAFTAESESESESETTTETTLPATGEDAGTSTTFDPPPEDGNPTSSSTTTDESGDTGKDMACVEVSRDCELYADDECPPGQQCRPWESGDAYGVGCVPRPPAGQLELGLDCDHLCEGEIGVDRCPPSTICDPHRDGSTCVPLCGPQGQCDTGFCEPHEGYGICRLECDLLEQNCPDGFACYTGDGAPVCQPVGKVEPGGGCGFLNECVLGSICVPDEIAPCPFASCCAEICEPGAGDCDAGDECIPLFDGAGVGVCVGG